MRVAYADPPYPGKARKYYRDHPDFAGEVDHAALVARLEDEFPDGWALSTSMSALPDVLALCPRPLRRGAAGGGVRRQFRTLAWCRSNGQQGVGGPIYGWEPVILCRCRRERGPRRPLDWLLASPETGQGIVGAKPPAFSRWLFACMGLEPGDDFADLFPGSGGVEAEWQRWRAQLSIEAS